MARPPVVKSEVKDEIDVKTESYFAQYVPYEMPCRSFMTVMFLASVFAGAAMAHSCGTDLIIDTHDHCWRIIYPEYTFQDLTDHQKIVAP